MEKSTKIGLIAGAITVIYTTVVTILAVYSIISFNVCAILIFAPILGVGIICTSLYPH